MTEARRIIICIDGTNNQVGDRQGNVVRFYRGLRKTSKQVTYYAMGVGTMGEQKLANDRHVRAENVRGMAFGFGLEDDVLNAYRYLCGIYDFAALTAWDEATPKERSSLQPPDQIYMVGFSRGSYACRMLAGFINDFGLVKSEELHLIPQVFRAYRKLSDADAHMSAEVKYKALRRYEQVFDVYHPPIEGLVLFDTVASMIRCRRVLHNLITMQSIIELATHPSTSVNPSVRFIIHAQSIDERRSFFRPLSWKTSVKDKDGNDTVPLYFGNRFREGAGVPQIIRQAWFAGSHGDVAGTVVEDRAGLSKITASWAIDQLKDVGAQWEWNKKEAQFDGDWEYDFIKEDILGDTERRTVDDRAYSKPEPKAPYHNSMNGAWRILEIIPKTLKRRVSPKWRKGIIWYIPWGEPRTIPDDAPLHPSVFERREAIRYDPPNIAHRKADDPVQHDNPALFNPTYSNRPQDS